MKALKYKSSYRVIESCAYLKRQLGVFILHPNNKSSSITSVIIFSSSMHYLRTSSLFTISVRYFTCIIYGSNNETYRGLIYYGYLVVSLRCAKVDSTFATLWRNFLETYSISNSPVVYLLLGGSFNY